MEELTQVCLHADGKADTFFCEVPSYGEELGRLDDGGDSEAEVRGRDKCRLESHFHSLEGASDLGSGEHLLFIVVNLCCSL